MERGVFQDSRRSEKGRESELQVYSTEKAPFLNLDQGWQCGVLHFA